MSKRASEQGTPCLMFLAHRSLVLSSLLSACCLLFSALPSWAASSSTLTSDFGSRSLTVRGGGQLNTNGWNVAVTSDVVLSGGGALDAASTYPGAASKPSLITVGRNWTLLHSSAVFTAATSTVAFVSSSSSQTVQMQGQAFNVLIASNTSTSGGLLFASSFSATVFTAASLPAASTITFTANSTATINSLTLQGFASGLIAVRSSTSGTWSFLNNTGSYAVSFADIQDNNAAAGLTILAGGSSRDSGHNVNWLFGAALFTGGAGDQYSSALNTADNLATIFSSSQTFIVGDPVTAISTLTITQLSASIITAPKDIRVHIPSNLHMSWDTSDTSAVLGGSAAGKVSTTVSYENAGATLLLDVTSDFVQGDVLTVSGLGFGNFSVSLPGYLEMEVDTGTLNAVDTGSKTIRYIDSPAVFTGDAGDQYALGAGGENGPVKTWLGFVDATWSSGDNWDARVPPNSSEAAVIVTTATNMPILDLDVVISTLTINAGTTTLTINGFNLTLSSLTNAGNLVLRGTETVTTAPHNLAGSTVTFNSAGNSILLSSWTYKSLVVNGAAGTFRPSGTQLTVGEHFTLSTGTLNLNASNVTVGGNWDVRNGAFNAGASSVTFTGTSAQSVYSSTRPYFAIVVANTAGVTFQDSLTVSTFTIIAPSAIAKLPIAPSSMTVLSYLNLNGQDTGTRAQLLSTVSGTPSLIRLVSGLTQNVLNTSIKDSSATITGVTGNATDPSNLDNTNNFNWTFPAARYWVAPSSGNWSDAANWSGTSGGAGGFGAPTASQQAIFDGNGLGNCTIDTAVAISTLTISTSAVGGYSGTVDTSSNAIALSSFTLNRGTFFARTSSITVTNNFTVSSGTYNGNTSSMTVGGDFLLSNGIYDAAGSTITALGNVTIVGGVWTVPTGKLILAGTSKTINGSGKFLKHVDVTGSYTASYTPSNGSVRGVLNITGTLTSASSLFQMDDGSTMTLTGAGTLNGDITMRGNAHIAGTGGTINALLGYSLCNGPPGFIPARVYDGVVQLGGSCGGNNSFVMGAGHFVFNRGLKILTGSTGNLTVTAAGANPSVTITSMTTTQSTSGIQILMGTGTWTASSHWDVRFATVTQTAGGVLKFSSTAVQNVYSSSATYKEIQVDNAAGVTFQDSLTVSTLTITTANALAKLQVAPSSLTVTTYLNLNGQAPGTRALLQSTTPGTHAPIVLLSGLTQNVLNTSIKDSDASSGVTGNATDSSNYDNGNNLNWTFPAARYWVAPSSGNWSDAANWSGTSGGAGGFGAPTASQQAIFDGNGLGRAMIDTAVNISTLTISTSTSGGYTGYLDTSSNTITVSSITMNNGTFYARTSSITVNGSVTIAGGTFNGNGSTITVSSDWDSSGGTWKANTGMVDLTGSGVLKQRQGSPWLYGFYTLKLAAAGKTTRNTTDQLYVDHLITGSGALTDMGTNASLFLSGVFDDGGASITLGSVFGYITSGQTIVGRDYSGVGSLWLYPNPGGSQFLQGPITAANTIKIYSAGLGNTSVLNTNGFNMTATSLQIGNTDLSTQYGKLNAGSSTITINGNVTVYLSALTNQNVINASSSQWTVSGNWTNRDTFNGETSRIIFSSTSAQTVWSSSSTYFQIDVANTVGVTFNDSLTVATFTMTTANALAKLPVAPSSVTVTTYLNLDGQAAGTRALLQSATPGSYAPIVLLSGLTQNVKNTSIRDSDASGGVTGDATDSSNYDNGHNLNWNFPATRYWVAPSSGNWSDAANWSGTSGGAGGFGAPTASQQAIFDGNGLGRAMIDTAVNISTLTISTSTSGGYTGYLDSSSNTITVSGQFAVNNGQFFARTSSITVNGSVIINGGAYHASSSSISVTGDWTLSAGATFNAGGSSTTFAGTSAQNVYSSSQTYFSVIVANTAGVTFQDSLTVSTFTVIAPSAIAKLPIAPSSMTVLSYLNLNGQDTGTRAQLLSAVPGTYAPLRLVSGITQNVKNTSIQDSDASGGVTGDATDSSNQNLGHNLNWNFGGAARYWVKASGTGNWSESDNWGTASGAVGGAGAPTAGQEAIFDAGGPGNCLIDQTVSISTLTISTSTGAGWNGTIDTSSYTITLSSFTQNFGTFYARTSTITINGGLTLSSGTFNANGSSITMSGNLLLSNGRFNAGSSTLAVTGHFTANNSALIPNWGTSTLNLVGSGKNLNVSGVASSGMYFYNLGIATITANNNPVFVYVNGQLSIGGTLTHNGWTWIMSGGSTVTLTGTLSGSGIFQLNDDAVLGTLGNLNVTTYFRTSSKNGAIPARVYNGFVYAYSMMGSASSFVMGAGTAAFNGNLQIHPQGAGDLTVDGSIHNPNVTATGITLNKSASGTPVLKAGTGTWTLSNSLIMTGGSFSQGVGGLMRFAGSTPYSIWSGSQTYSHIEVVNTSSVTFRDSLAVSTLTLTTANAWAKLPVSPSSMTVTTYLNLNGQASETRARLESATPGTPGLIRLVSGLTQNVSNTSIKDSSATVDGVSGNATDSSNLDNTGNFNWLFTGARYWIAPSSGSWSNSWNWSTTSGGTGGASVPSGDMHAVFDAGGPGRCMIDTAVSISTLTVSTSITGGYTGYLDTSSNTITVSGQFTANSGQFYARTSSITINGSVSINGGTYNAESSSISVTGDWTLSAGATFNAGGSSTTFAGTSAQNVYSSSQTYFSVIVANTAGVTFQDSLTVSTFTMTTANALAKLQVSPSSVTVTTYLNLNGQASGTRAQLQSLVPGTRAPIYLVSGITQTVLNTSIKDSSASLVGATGDASDSSNYDNGNNFNWTFPTARYWIVPSSGNWSDAWNWATTSGGEGGAGAPGSSMQAIFDANGQGRAMIDTAVSISALTISTSTSGGYTGYLDTSSNTITVNSFTQNKGIFYARTSSITVNGGFTVSSGTFNANSSSITVTGNILMDSSTYNAGASVVTASGNVILDGTLAYTGSSERFVLVGTNKLLSGLKFLRNVDVIGTYTGVGTTITGVLNVSGSVIGASSVLRMENGSTLQLTGLVEGRLVIRTVPTVVISTGGTLNAWLDVTLCNGSGSLPARVYGGLVSFVNSCGGSRTMTFGAGSITFGNGLSPQVTGAGNTTLDFATNNPTVLVTSLTPSKTSTGFPVINMGSGTWTSTGLWDVRVAQVTQSVFGILRFSSTTAQNVYSSSAAYHHLQVANTSGVTFKDSLTVATFTITTPSALAKLPVAPSSVTVMTYLNMDGQAVGTRALLQSATAGTRAPIYLVSGITQNVRNTSIKDSSASLVGMTGDASDSSNYDNSNNFNWNFPTSRYWVAPSSGVWSSTANWSQTSGGSGGYSAPTSGMQAIFDGNGQGRAMIDTAVSISTLTISTSTSGGYTGYLDTSSNTITVSGQLTVNSGQFFARTSSITLNGGITISSGTFNSNGSTLTVTGNVLLNNGLFNADSSSISVTGDWSNTSTVFSGGTSVVTFAGASGSTSTLTGASSFTNLMVNMPGKVFAIAAGSTETVTGLFTLQGASGNPILVRSGTPGAYAFLINSGTNTISFVDVQDNNASGGETLRAGTSSNDSGHNVNWSFGEPAPTFQSISAVYVSSISVQWGTVSSLTGYIVDASTVSNFNGQVFSSTTIDATLNILAVQSLAANATYYLRVGSLWNGTTTYVTPPPLSTATLTNYLTGIPQFGSVQMTSVSVNWVSLGVGNAIGYRLEASTSSTFSPLAGSSVTYDALLSTLTISNLVPQTTYYFRVGGLNWNYVPNYGATFSTQTLAVFVPTGLTGTALGVSSISWTWNTVSGADSYNLYQATSPTTLVASGIGSASYNETGLSTNTAYGRVVSAVVSGVESALSGAVTTYTLASVPGVPTFSNVAYTSFTLTWTANGNPVGTRFEVSGSTDNFATNFSTPIAFADNFTSYTTTFVMLTPGTTYYLRVRAENGVNGAVPDPAIVTAFTTTTSTVTLTAPHMRYWIRTSGIGNWSDSSNWAYQSGGIGGATVPTASHQAIFDANGVGNCLIDQVVSVSTLTISTNTSGGYTGYLDTSSNTITISGQFAVNSGQFFARTSSITVIGSVTVAGGTFNAETSSLTLSGDWTIGAAATFSAGTSTVAFVSTSAQVVNTSGQSFATVIASNTAAGGITFQSSFSAVNFIASGLTAASTIYFNANSTYTITNMVLQAASGQLLAVRSSVPGTYAYLTTTNNTIFYVDAKDSNAGNGATINASDGTSFNAGHNVNWNFGGTARYWVKATGTGNWSDSDNWGVTSGGPGGAGQPAASQQAVFDSNGLGNCFIDQAVSVSTLTISTSTSGGYTGYLDTSSNTITVSGQLTVNSGQFYARTSSITVNGSVSINGGTYNAESSSISVTGDWTLSAGATFNAGGSSTTFAGTSAQNVYSSSKTYFSVIVANTSGVTFQDSLTVSTFTMTTPNASAKLQVAPSSMTVTTYLNMNGQATGTRALLQSATDGSYAPIRLVSGVTQNVLNTSIKDSSATVDGVSGNATDSSNLDATGNFNWNFGASPRYWVAPSSGNWSNSANWSQSSGGAGGAGQPAANQPAVFDGNGQGYCLIDTAVSVSALTIGTSTSGGYTGYLDTSSNTITISGQLTVNSGQFFARTSSITVTGDWTLSAGATFNAGGSSTTFAGTSAQNVYSSSKTYFSVIVANTAGVNFQDSLTVSTFTMTTANALAKLQTGTSSMTVTGYLNLNGQATGSRALLQSTNPGNRALIVLKSGLIQNVLHTSIQDSDASNGVMGNALDASNLDSGNNLNWNFGTLYWVPPTSGTWSNAANWSYTSGGPGGAIVPASNHHAIFNGAGKGRCMIDTAVSISTLTISSSSIGGFTNYIDTSSNTITISSFTLNFGTFYARTSSITVASLTLSSGTFFAAGSTVSVSGDWRIRDSVSYRTSSESLYFNGTMAQNVYSSSRTYARVFADNPAGVHFQDTLTVSTFSMTTANAVARLQVSPSSMTVRTYLNLNGQASGTRAQLQSLVPGTRALIVLRSGLTQNVQNASIQDSDASGGVIGNATAASNVNNGNNVNWNFGSRYWIAPSSGNWSQAWNWATTSGGAGGAGAPAAFGHAIFDGNGLGNSTIDTAVNISTLTMGTTAGSGYTGSIDTSSNTIIISSFTQNFGAFYARTSSMTIGNMLIASGTYNAGLSSVTTTGSLTLSSATFNAETSSWIVRGSVNLSTAYQGGVFNAGGSSMTVLGSWTIGRNLVFNTATETLAFSGTAAQNVWSSSRTYFHVQVANTAGVTFQDSLTVSTFTMTAANALAKFQIGSSSVTVTGYLNLNGPSLASRVLLQSRTTNSRALIVLVSGVSQTVLNASIKDSDASNGVTGDASDSSNVNNGNNLNWNFPEARYWVAPSSGNWSDAANWSGTSGGAGGFGAPTTFQQAIFDANGQGYCLINTAVAISTLTISPTMGSGYTGYLDTSTNTLTISSFTLNNGTFYARNSSMTIRNMAISSGTYYAGSSSVTLITGFTLGQATFHAETSSWTFRAHVNLGASGEAGIFNAGGSTMTVLANWAVGPNLVYNAGTETLAFKGTSAQNVYSSSKTYWQIQVANPSGVTFNDSLTVSTFAMTTANAMAKLQVAPSSMTVTGYLNLNGQATGTRAQLQSISTGVRAPIVLLSGLTQTVRNTNIQDSDASNGVAGDATDSSNFDSGNNLNWNFAPTRYWVPPSSGNWSNSGNWSTSSGGAGGASVPASGQQAIFDANGPGNCTIDTAVNVGAIILSTYVGAGYNGFLDTSSHPITVNSFTQNHGTFYARTSGFLAGEMALSGGLFEAGGSSLSVSGNWAQADPGVFTAGTSSVTFTGNTPTLTGSTTFYNFVYTVAGGTLTLPANSTQTISGLLRLAGNSSNQTLVRSSLSGTYAYFKNSGLNSVSYVDAKDNNAAGGTVILAGTTSINSGNLVNWAFAFTVTPIDLNGPGGGLGDGSSVWGDFNNDGRLDIAVDGQGIGGVKRLWVFLNNGDDTFTKLEVASGTVVAFPTSLAAGDYNNDGFLDLAANGYGSAGAAVHAYRNNGDNTFTLVDVAGPAAGLAFGNVAWGDFNNDGLLDLWASGQDAGGSKQIWVFKNNGDGTWTKFNVAAAGTAIFQESIALGDYNNDGFIDLTAVGTDRTLRLYKNNGNGTFTKTNITGVNATLFGGQSDYILAWGDANNDGWLDIAITGATSAAARSVWIYQNNSGNGTFTLVDVAGPSAGLTAGSLAWGDYDNDGRPDLAVMGQDISIKRRVWVYRNNGDLTFTKLDVAGTGGLFSGSVIWGDYNGDGALDLAINGYNDSGTYGLSIYKNMYASLGVPNTAPTAPATLSGSFDFTSVSISTAVFKWNPGSDSGAGATNATTLNYELRVATVSSFSPTTLMPGLAATPLMGNYLRPPKIYDANSNHGVFIVSTQPWVHTSSYGLQTDTTYYYQVRTIDAGLLASAWSSNNTLYTGVSPSAVSDLLVSTTVAGDSFRLTWTAPGNDQNMGDLNPGTFRIFYSTESSDVVGLLGTTPTTASLHKVDISTSGVVFGSSHTYTLTGISGGATYYIRLFTGDQVPNWSDISNGATAQTPIFSPIGFTGAVLGTSSITWSWSDPRNLAVDGYLLQDGVGATVQSLSSTTFSAVEVDLSTNTLYTRKVQAYTATSSSATDTVSRYTFAAPPTGTSLADVALTSITVQWNVNGNPAGTRFQAYFDTQASFATAVSSDTALNIAVSTGLTSNATYYLHVKAQNGDGVDTSYDVTLTTVTLPATPTSGSFTSISDVALSIAWSGATNASGTSYQAEISTISTVGAAVQTAVTTALSTAFSGLNPDTTYYARVRSLGWTGTNSAYLIIGSTVTALTAPTQLVFSSVQRSSVAFDWQSATASNIYFVAQLAASNPFIAPDSSTTYVLTATFTALSANTLYYARVQSVNGDTGAASSWSSVISTYTLANAPINLTATVITDTSISMIWLGNGNPSNTFYSIERSTDGVTFAVVGSVNTTSYQDTTLAPGTPYSYRVRAYNGSGLPSDYTNTILETTTGQSSNPRAPFGLWAERTATAGVGNYQVTYQWHRVVKRVNGSTLSNLVGYQIYQSASLLTPRAQWAPVATVTGETWTTTATATTVLYYCFRTVDTSGLVSDWSEIMDDGSDLNHFFLASDNITRLQLPQNAANVLRRERNSYGADLTVELSEVSSEETGRVVKSVQIDILNTETGNQITDLTFDPPILRGSIGFTVQNGKVVAGSPGRGFVGTPVIDASQAAQSLSLFWYNGNDWVKTTSLVNTGDNTVSFTGSRAGRYQIRVAQRSPGVTLTRVYPRIISPNGDSWNDKVIFQFDNPQLVPLSGKIYDLSGAFVADMAAGPNPDSTLVWDGKDSSGAVVPGGVYLYQADAASTITGTIVVAR